MRKLIPILVVSIMAVSSLTGCQSAVPGTINVVNDTINKVTVQGTSKITVVPDIFIINCDVSTIKDNAADAQNSTSEKFKTVTNKLKELGIEEKYIKTTAINLNEEYDYTKESKVFKGYRSTMSLEIKVIDMTKTGTILSDVTQLGVDNIWGIKYDISNKDDKYNEALALAVENASVKANSMLAKDNMKTGDIIDIQENMSSYSPVYKNDNLAYDTGGASESGIMQGEQEISANLSVTFEIVK